MDDETNHAPEVVGYVAFGSFEKGPIMGRSNLNLGCEGIYDATSAQLGGGAKYEAGNPSERGCADQVHDPTAGVHSQTDVTCHMAERGSSTIGVGAIDFVNAEGDDASWHVHLCRPGHVWLVFGYALGGGADRPMEVKINDDVVDGFMSFPPTGGWTSYSEVKIPAMLQPGTNHVTLTAIGYSGPD